MPRKPTPEITGGLLTRNSVRNLVGLGLPLVVALVAIPPVIRGLGPERFGVLALAWMVLGYFGELGFGRATTRFAAEALAGDREDRSLLGPIFWTTGALQLALGMVGMVALLLAVPLLVERILEIPSELTAETGAAFRVLALGLPPVLLATTVRGMLEAAHRFDLVNVVRIPASTANYLLPLVGVWAGWDLPAILGVLVVARVAALGGYVFLTLRLFPELVRPTLAGAGSTRRLLSFGGWVMVSSAVSPVLVYLDRFLLGALVSMTAVTLYTAPYELATRTLIVPASVASALFPAFSGAGGAEAADAGRALLARSAGWVLAILGPVCLILAAGAGPVIHLWLGEGFGADSVLALRILALGVLVNGLAQVAYSLLQGLERADLTGIFHLIELPVQLALAWVLIRAWGVPGAAAAWTIRVSLDALLLYGATFRVARTADR